jgi:hypothetical protein
MAGRESFFPNLYIHCELFFSLPSQYRNPGPNRNLTLGPNPNPNPDPNYKPLTLYLLRYIVFAMDILDNRENKLDILVMKKNWRAGPHSRREKKPLSRIFWYEDATHM